MTAEPGKDSLTDLLPTPGDHLKRVLEGAPELMAELTRQFIEKKDLNSRTALRLRMKAMLDLIAVDTQYPPIPMLGGSGGAGAGVGLSGQRFFQEPVGIARPFGGPLYDNEQVGAAAAPVAPIAGAAPPPPSNEDILGG